MTPDKMRLSGLTNSTRGDSCGNDTIIGSHHKQILLTPEEAVVMMHGEIETVRDGNVTHQAIQTNLADVICGGKRSLCTKKWHRAEHLALSIANLFAHYRKS